MKRFKSDCPVVATLSLLSNSWKFLIIRDLMGGSRRFGELKSSVTGISPKALTTNLRELTEDGIITRTFYAEIPPRTEYTLTELGKKLCPVVGALAKWGLEYQEMKRNMPESAHNKSEGEDASDSEEEK